MIDLPKLPIKTGPVKKGKEKTDDIQSPAIIEPSPQSVILRRRRPAVANIMRLFPTHTQAQSTEAHESAIAAASSSNVHELERAVASPPLIPR